MVVVEVWLVVGKVVAGVEVVGGCVAPGRVSCCSKRCGLDSEIMK